MFEFVHKARRNVPKLISMIMPDVVICSSTYPLDTYIGQKIKRISNKTVKLVHEIHDMWPLTPVELGHMSKWNPFIWLLQRAENSFCRNADEVVSLLPEAKSYLMDHGMNRTSIMLSQMELFWKSGRIHKICLHALKTTFVI